MQYKFDAISHAQLCLAVHTFFKSLESVIETRLPIESKKGSAKIQSEVSS